ncbi:MAG: glycosyltransferase family 4 protein [Bacilli bacterium]|nr:glycosyltransferase family 4 protein [Bacilli bacterium]
MIGPKTVPSRDGGIEVVVGELSTRLAALGNDVTIFNRKRKHKKGEQILTEYHGCHLKEIFTINKKGLDAIVYSFFATIKAKKMARKGEIDVIHYHAEGPCFFLWMFGKKHKGYKLVVTIHGLDWQRSKWGGFGSKMILQGEKRAVKYADQIIVLSKNNQKYFSDKYTRKTVFIPNGISPVCFHEPELIKKQWGLEKGSYVLFLGRIVPEKGCHYLIKAWKQLKQEFNTDKKLVIAGKSSHSDEYFDSICNMVKGDSSIIMTGFVEGQALQELYSNAYLFVLPSDIEGMPMSLLEAMAYGNVCLVSDIPENKDLIDGRSYVFKTGDWEQLSAKLFYIIEHEKVLVHQPYIKFPWNDVVFSTLQIYREKI